MPDTNYLRALPMLLLLLQAALQAFPVPAPDAVAESQKLTYQEPTAGPMGQARAH